MSNLFRVSLSRRTGVGLIGEKVDPPRLSSDDPVTKWIDDLRNADEVAARKLWNHFVERLYELGRKKLQLGTRTVYDEEDAAQSAFHSVCVGIRAGRFPDLRDRRGLWYLLVAVTAHKVAHRHRYDRRHRRDIRRNVPESSFMKSARDPRFAGLDALESREPTADFAAQFVETCEQLFEELKDPEMRKVVKLRLEGYTDPEIADELDCSIRTVQRRLEVIRRQWSSGVAE